jgi:RNA polymerase-binding transcription factor DksA
MILPNSQSIQTNQANPIGPADSIDPILATTKTKEELEKELEQIKKILARRGHKDPKIKANYIADYQVTNTDVQDPGDDVFEEEEYDINLAVVNVLEKRLLEIENQLKQMEM